MKGLELCRSYYEEVGAPALRERFPELMPRAAAGLCGQGSDCLGLDDEYSRDHDFGPGFCLCSRPTTLCRRNIWASRGGTRTPARSGWG